MKTKKISFNMKHADLIKSGKYKVETKSGLPVRIICWDAESQYFPIVGLVKYNLAGGEPNPVEIAYHYSRLGYASGDEAHVLDLVTVTDEPEYSDFENVLRDLIGKIDGDYYVVLHDYDDYIKEFAPKVLEAAKKELEKTADDTRIPMWHTTMWRFGRWTVNDENGKPIICDGYGHHLYLEELEKYLPTCLETKNK